MLAEQALQQGNLTVAGNFKELLFNRRERVDSVDLNGLRITLHPAADRRDCRRPVAENSSVCRSAGAKRITSSMASLKPISSMRSASSITEGLQRVKGRPFPSADDRADGPGWRR